MQIVSSQINKERLHGNKLFLHNFKDFSTSSPKISLKMHTIHAMLFILIIISTLYIVTVISIIFNIINKKESLAEINNTNFSIAKINKTYNASVSSLTKEYALSNGYVESKDNFFVSRKDAAANLSFLYENHSN
jgi:competence protein ComGC